MAMSRSFGAASFTRRPAMRSSPLVMSSRPATIRSAVDFPHPEGPTSTKNSPSWMSTSRSFTASRPSGYTFETLSRVTCATTFPLSYRLAESACSVHRLPPACAENAIISDQK